MTSFETVFTHSEESRGVLILAVFQSGVIMHFLHVVHCCIRYFPYMQKICCHCGNEHRHHCLVWPCFLSLGFTETCACACVCLQQIAASTYHTEICSLHWQNWPIIHPSVHPTIHPFIHPTIHAIRPLSRLQVQNSRQRCPHLLLPSHLLQHFWGDTNVLSKPRNLISAACAGSALRMCENVGLLFKIACEFLNLIQNQCTFFCNSIFLFRRLNRFHAWPPKIWQWCDLL